MATKRTGPLAEARAKLAEAVEGLALDEGEQRTLAWLGRWEPETIGAVASVIRKARQSSEPTTPPPDPDKPYVWAGGRWLLVVTDKADES